ncbi:MAG: hypothetical protein KF718_06895 [Polyangiaceae bacterium]|nr:hypothetical protein [Polyangiaceae bacterium]
MFRSDEPALRAQIRSLEDRIAELETGDVAALEKQLGELGTQLSLARKAEAAAHRRLRNLRILVAAAAGALSLLAWWVLRLPRTESATAGQQPGTFLVRYDETGQCPDGSRLEQDKGCVWVPIIIEPGRGLLDLEIGKSTPEDVLRVFGSATQLYRYPKDKGPIQTISYRDEYDSPQSWLRPSSFSFKDGKLDEIFIGFSQRHLTTPEGIGPGRPAKLAFDALGPAYEQRESTGPLEMFLWRARGIELWVGDKGTINSMRVLARNRHVPKRDGAGGGSPTSR